MSVRDERGEIGVAPLIIFGLFVSAMVGVTIWVLVTSTNIMGSMAQEADRHMDAWENGKVTQGVAENVGDYTTIGEKLKGRQTDIVLVLYNVDGTDYECKYLVDSEAFDQIDGDDQDGKGDVEVHYDPSDPSYAMIEAAVTSGKVVLDS